MGTRTLILLRHGQYEAEGIGVLTPLGRHQARESARFLGSLPIDAVWSSTLPRARETAEIVADAMGATYRATRVLREGLYSKVEGYAVPASERREDRARADRAYAQFFRKSRRDRVELIVCHGNLIRYLVCRALRAPLPRWLRMTTNHCGVTRVLIRGTGAVRLVSYNETSHLPADLVT